MLSVRTVLGCLAVQTFCIYATIGVNKKSLFKNLEEDIKKLKANRVKCMKEDLNTILRLKCEDKLDKAMLCIGQKLLVNGGSKYGELWTHLGQIYHAQGKINRGNKCFKEAAKIHGKFTARMTLWHFIGPFQIGKTEIDGDPIEAIGGIEKILCQRYNKDFLAYSELVSGGEVGWSTIEADSNGIFTVAPLVNWEQLAAGLRSHAVVDWQGWLVGDFATNSEMTVLIQCLGVSKVYIDGNILAGDLYRRNNYWHPIHLKPGVHSVLLHARSNGDMKFTCNLRPADEAPFFNVHRPFTPDLVDGHIFSDLLTIPVTNHNPRKWLTITDLTLVSQKSGPDMSVRLYERQHLSIAPGQIHSIIARLQFKDDKQKLVTCPRKDIEGKLQLRSSESLKNEVSFTIRCRERTQSFLFTFVDHDGSLQNAAAIFPIVKKETVPSKIYPVLLTLHGIHLTGSAAQKQADSYKRMENNNWIFGAEGLWTLAPTRHGAHNWEGPGELTAMTSLLRLAELTLKHDWINAKANDKAVVFAGHSIGGHGAWQLSTHYPDIALAVISIAGWPSKESYGEENTFFKHDISVSHTDSSVKYVMESCIIENDSEKHVSNLKGIPVMVRTGAMDTTVMPYFSKRMYRLLKEQGNNVTYTELANKEHWWWDSYNTNDGGATNDPDIRNFLQKHTNFAIKRTSNPACSKLKDEKTCGDERSTYSAAKVINRNFAGSGEFLLTVYNPASSYGLRGVQVIQQATPFRKSTVHINFTEFSVTMVTSNVIRLRLNEPAISQVHWSERRVIVDDVEILLDQNNGNVFDLCVKECKSWKLCEDESVESETQRGPSNLGPARRVAERPLLVIIDTSRKSEASQAFLQIAVYIANLFFLTSDSIVPIMRNKDVVDEKIRDHNLIIIGDISFAAPHLQKVPLRFGKDQSLSLGHCVFKSPNMGILSLVPHSGSRLALILTGTSLSSIRDVMHLATPTIPPMTRSPFSNLVPDYVITGPEFRARGPGGYLCAGFWGNRWEYRSEVSSCAC